jgi:hypothetical protein
MQGNPWVLVQWKQPDCDHKELRGKDYVRLSLRLVALLFSSHQAR